MTALRLALLVVLALPAVAQAAEPTLVTRELPVRSGRTLAGAAARFNLVGLHWQGPGRVLFRTRSVAGRWSRWRPAAPEAEDGPDADEGRRRGWRIGNPFWTGASDRIEYRVRGHVRRLRAHFVWSPVEAVPARSLTLAGAPPIVPRPAWQASERIRRAGPRYAPVLRLALVHHTAGANGYSRAQSAAIVRGIQLFHVVGNGWDDIGYNFLVDRFGQVFEGRYGGLERNVVGAHAQGFNSGSVGVAVIGNYDGASISAAARATLARLLAWRLDVAHLDPLAPVTFLSGGNPRFPAGVPIFLRAVSGHRDTGFTTCPGGVLYAELGALARQASITGTPKLYSPAAAVASDRVRFTGRLSAPLPWEVAVADARGARVAGGTGTGTRVDWSWQVRGVLPGRYAWAMRAGPFVREARGTVSVGSLPALTLAEVAADPAVVSPNGDGLADSTVIRFRLALAATVTATVLDAEGEPLASLFTLAKPAGRHEFRWYPDALADGLYDVVLTARTVEGREVAQTVRVAINRTLGRFSALPAAFSPNGDARSDTLRVAFTLAAPAAVTAAVRDARGVVATLLAAQLAPGAYTAEWDGRLAGRRAPDGAYRLVVDAVNAAGTASLGQTVTLDTRPPELRLVSAKRLRAWVSEPATVTLTASGRRVVQHVRRAGVFRLMARRPFRSLRAVARDAAGNDSRPLTLKR